MGAVKTTKQSNGTESVEAGEAGGRYFHWMTQDYLPEVTFEDLRDKEENP